MPIKRNIYLLYAIALLQGMCFYGPIATLYRQMAGVNIFQITIIESVSMVLCVVLEMPWGVVADKIGYRKTMIMCCGMFFVSKIVFWRANGFSAFMAERVILSVVVAGLSGVDASMLYLSCGEGESQRTFGIYNNLGTLGLIAASGVYVVFIKADYRLAGLLTVASYGVAAVLALGLKEVRSGERSNGYAEFRGMLVAALKDKRLLMLLLAVALFSETHQTVTVFLNQLQYKHCGLNDAQIGIAYIWVTLAGLLGGYSAWLTKRIGATRLGRWMFLSASVACLTLALTRSAMLSIACIMLIRVSYSLFQPLHMALQNQAITSHNRATALSINAVLIEAVAIFSNIAFGGLAQMHLPLSMAFGACLCAIGCVLFTFQGKILS